MKRFSTLLFVATGLLAMQAMALSPKEVQIRLHKARPDIPIASVNESAVEGLYEARLPGGQVLFVTDDGEHFFTGDLYRITDSDFVNLSEQKRTEGRKEMLNSIDDADKLVFSPPADQVKATINVFTDVDCGYCRKLHQEVPELNRMGVAVKYLAYPRAGIGSKSYDKIVSAWCAEDPNEALTRAKAGETIPEKTCDNPVADQFRLGNEIGVTGTPAIVYSDGTLQPGYLPAKQMAARLGIQTD